MERWIMNRLGFVNFWVYDTEEFPFRNGKLLLRGLNGSGKSITTQSCIPYILDGDRTPSRLDPFGTKDRKMEYYLLGDPDSGKEESIRINQMPASSAIQVVRALRPGQRISQLYVLLPTQPVAAEARAGVRTRKGSLPRASRPEESANRDLRIMPDRTIHLHPQ